MNDLRVSQKTGHAILKCTCKHRGRNVPGIGRNGRVIEMFVLKSSNGRRGGTGAISFRTRHSLSKRGTRHGAQIKVARSEIVTELTRATSIFLKRIIIARVELLLLVYRALMGRSTLCLFAERSAFYLLWQFATVINGVLSFHFAPNNYVTSIAVVVIIWKSNKQLQRSTSTNNKKRNPIYILLIKNDFKSFSTNVNKILEQESIQIRVFQ